MLTNFATIRKAVKKMAAIDKMGTDGTFDNMSKRERLQVMRERAKLEKQLGSIVDLNRLPAAVFVVDICKEHIAVAEARKLNIPTFAIVDTNANPNEIDFPIPANDDASKSIQIIVKLMIEAIQEGLEERKLEKDKAVDEDDDVDVDIDDDATEKGGAGEVEDEDEVALRKAKAAKKAKIASEDDEQVKAPKAPKGAPLKKPQAKRPRL